MCCINHDLRGLYSKFSFLFINLVGGSQLASITHFSNYLFLALEGFISFRLHDSPNDTLPFPHCSVSLRRRLPTAGHSLLVSPHIT